MAKKKVSVDPVESAAAAEPAALRKTGEVRFREPDGSLWVAESFVNDAGEVSTQSMQLEPAPAAQEV